MPSLVQIEAALRGADAAGDVEAAKQLAGAYRAKQQQIAQTRAENLKPAMSPVPESTMGRLAAGAGSGMADTWLGARQVTAAVLPGDDWDNKLKQEAEEKRRTDAPLLATTAGRVGNIGGQIVATAPLMLIPGAGPEMLAGRAALAARAGIAAGTGAAAGALTPTVEGESRLANMGTGAALGGVVGTALPAAANLLGKAATKVTTPVEQLAARGKQLGMSPRVSYTGGNWVAKAEAAADSNPLTSLLGSFSHAKDQTALNRIVGKAIGAGDVDHISADVFHGARLKAQDTFRALADEEVRPVSQEGVRGVVENIAQKLEDAGAPARDGFVNSPLVKDLVDTAGTENLTGRFLAQLQSRLRVAATQQFKSPTGNRELGGAFNQLKQSVDELLLEGKDAATQQTVRNARQSYRILKMLEPSGVLSTETGNVNGKILANVLKSKDAINYLSKTETHGLRDVYDAARYFKAKPSIPNSGTATRGGNTTAAVLGTGLLGVAKAGQLTSGLSRAAGRGASKAIAGVANGTSAAPVIAANLATHKTEDPNERLRRFSQQVQSVAAHPEAMDHWNPTPEQLIAALKKLPKRSEGPVTAEQINKLLGDFK